MDRTMSTGRAEYATSSMSACHSKNYIRILVFYRTNVKKCFFISSPSQFKRNRKYPSLHLGLVVFLEGLLRYFIKGGGVSRDHLLVEHQTRHWKVASSNPGRSGRRIFLSRVNLCWLLLGVCSTPCYCSGTWKIPVILPKVQGAVTPKHAYTLDPRKSEWADYNVQA